MARMLLYLWGKAILRSSATIRDINLSKSAAILILLVVPTWAWTLPIVDEQSFSYDGRCGNTSFSNCAFIGLRDGDQVSGLISFVNADENRLIEAAEITGWDFTFGRAMFDSSTHTLSGGLVLNSDGTGFGGFLFEGLFFTPRSNGTGTTYTGVTGSLFFGALDGWVVRACRGGLCARASGGGSYMQVSEPGTLMLLGIGLVAAGIVRRRRAAVAD